MKKLPIGISDFKESKHKKVLKFLKIQLKN
jgi:hypothetical protein